MDRLNSDGPPLVTKEAEAVQAVEIKGDSGSVEVVARPVIEAVRKKRARRAVTEGAEPKRSRRTAAELFSEALKMYMSGEKEDSKRALPLAQRAAKLGHVEATALVGRLYMDLFKYREALQYLTTAANAGSGEAHFDLGFLYDNGCPDIEWDKAVFHYQLAVDLGVREALFHLGVLRAGGFGCQADIEEAIRLLLLAPEDEHVCSRLSGIYLDRGDVEKALVYFKKGIDLGDLDALHELAELYMNEEYDEVEKDLSKALSVYEMGIERNDSRSFLRAGEILIDPTFPSHNPQRGYELIESAYKEGNTEAGCILAKEICKSAQVERLEDAVEMLNAYIYDPYSIKGMVAEAKYYLGIIQLGKVDRVVRDAALGLRNIKESAAMRQPRALCLMGQMYMEGEMVRKNEPLGFLLFLTSSKLGCIEAKINVAECFIRGIGVQKVPERGFRCYYELRESQKPLVIFRLGKCYREAIGTEKNDRLAFQYNLLAAMRNHRDAYDYAGMDFLFGKGVVRDYSKAKVCFSKSGSHKAKFYQGLMVRGGLGHLQNIPHGIGLIKEAAEKEVQAMMYLGRKYYEGRMIAVNYPESFKMFKRAAIADPTNALAAKIVGCMLAEGKGTIKDREEAEVWLLKASDLGHLKAYRILQGYKNLWAQDDMLLRAKTRI